AESKRRDARAQTKRAQDNERDARAQTKRAEDNERDARAQTKRAEDNERAAKRQGRMARADALAGEARMVLGKLLHQTSMIPSGNFPQRSLLLAAEAASLTLREQEPIVLAAEQALRLGLASSGGQRPKGLAQGDVVHVTPDNRRVIV